MESHPSQSDVCNWYPLCFPLNTYKCHCKFYFLNFTVVKTYVKALLFLIRNIWRNRLLIIFHSKRASVYDFFFYWTKDFFIHMRNVLSLVLQLSGTHWLKRVVKVWIFSFGQENLQSSIFRYHPGRTHKWNILITNENWEKKLRQNIYIIR